MSDALRRPAAKSTETVRGSVAADVEIVFESNLERKALACLRANGAIRRLREQFPRIKYYDSKGNKRHTVCDFYVEYWCGHCEVILVKPTKKLRSGGKRGITFTETVRSIKPKDFAEYASTLVVLTDKEVTDDDFYNADWILRSRDHRDEGDVAAMKSEVFDIRGQVRFFDLLQGPLGEARRRTAVWNLIDDGILLAAEKGRVADASFVKVDPEWLDWQARQAA